jgi:hypothetical protein
MKKRFLNYLAAFVAGALLTGWAYTSHDNSAQDAADYASTHGICKAGQR